MALKGSRDTARDTARDTVLDTARDTATNSHPDQTGECCMI